MNGHVTPRSHCLLRFVDQVEQFLSQFLIHGLKFSLDPQRVIFLSHKAVVHAEMVVKDRLVRFQSDSLLERRQGVGMLIGKHIGSTQCIKGPKVIRLEPKRLSQGRHSIPVLLQFGVGGAQPWRELHSNTPFLGSLLRVWCSTQGCLLLPDGIGEPMVSQEDKFRLIREYRTYLLSRIFDELSRKAPRSTTQHREDEIVTTSRLMQTAARES